VSIYVPQVIESLGDTGRDVSLVALLAYIGWDIADNEQLFPAPDFQGGPARL
jgi:hypothetical protein